MQEQEDGEPAEERGSADAPRVQWLLNEVFPQLTGSRGQVKFSRRHSTAILTALYASHVFSAWGDRMWQFLVTILLALLYPGSLLLPAVFGLLLALLVALLGTVIGDWVDGNQRMRVVWVSLLVQNGLVCACAVALAVLFGRDLDICGDVSLPVFISLTTVVILLGATANLATVANTIAIEKDWVVVIADRNKNTLASLNTNMRRIDLLCKLLAPAVAGVILQFAGPLATTIIVALWNAVSFFAELGLVVLVYHWVPALANKTVRKMSVFESLDEKRQTERGSEERESEEKEGSEERGSEEGSEEEEEGEAMLQFQGDDEETELFSVEETTVKTTTKSKSSSCRYLCVRVFSLFFSLRAGWSIFMHQQIALAGIAMATIYLTVLGFSGVTATYFLTQGLPNAAIGAAQGIGAVFGVSGTIAYPFIRRRIGTVRTGMFGISCQLIMLSLCAISVLIPGRRIANQAGGYYSAHCSADDVAGHSMCYFETASTTMGMLSATPTPSPSNLLVSTLSPSNTPLAMPSPSPSNQFARGIPGMLTSSITPTMSCLPTTHTPEPDSGDVTWGNANRVAPLVLMLGGVILARFGLWIFDLAVQQLVQETVAEDTRGVVGGVMNAMNSIMDMMHYVLVIAAPRPEHFGILTLISVAMVSLGALFYALYLRRVRGHFFHCRQYYQKCRGQNGHAMSRELQLVQSEDNIESSMD